jgi:hypothetical protein
LSIGSSEDVPLALLQPEIIKTRPKSASKPMYPCSGSPDIHVLLPAPEKYVFPTAVLRSPVKKRVAPIPATFNDKKVAQDDEPISPTQDDFNSLLDPTPHWGQEPYVNKQEPILDSKETFMSRLYDYIIDLGLKCEDKTSDKKVCICAVVVTKKTLAHSCAVPNKTSD